MALLWPLLLWRGHGCLLRRRSGILPVLNAGSGGFRVLEIRQKARRKQQNVRSASVRCWLWCGQGATHGGKKLVMMLLYDDLRVRNVGQMMVFHDIL